MKMISLREVQYLCLVCTAVGVVVDGSIVRGPRNQAVISGQRMTMECTVDGNSSVAKWQMTKPIGHEKERILRTSANGTVTLYPAFRNFSCAVNAKGSGFIFTNSTQSKDAGIYFCYVDPEELQSSAHLIVFESEPSCEFNGTSSDNLTFALGDLISMRCTAKFNGLWTPSVEWRRRTANPNGSEDDGGSEAMTEGVTTDSSFNISISSELNVVVDFHQHTYFSFRIFFRWPNDNDTIPVNATNLPDFEYEWKSPEVMVSVPETEVAEPPVVFQVIAETVTSEVGSDGGWYLTSVMLSVALLVFVFAVVGLVARRCYVGYRRVNGLDERIQPVNAAVLRGLERPASGEYDVIAFASPNIYETINDNEARATTCETTTCQEQHQQQQPTQHHPLADTYSQLSPVTVLAPGAYDALSLYLPMESPSRAPQSNPLASFGETEKVNSEHFYTSASKSNGGTGKSDYLALVEEGEQPAMNATSTCGGGGGDVDDYVQTDEKEASSSSSSVYRLAKTTDNEDEGDYLTPCS